MAAPRPEQEQPGPLAGRVVRSVKWSAATRVLTQLAQFGTQILLARLLTPADFGVAAVALVVANFALLVSDLGVGAALIHGPDASRRRQDTAFWLNALIGAGLAGIIIGGAAPIAGLLDQPAATGPLRVAGAACALALYAVPLALLERRLELRLAGVLETVSAVVGSCVGVAAALAGAGVYSIVLVPLATVASNSMLFLVCTRYRPGSFIDPAEAGSILRYVRGLVGFNVINYFTRNTDTVLLARFGTAPELGYYSRAFSLMLLPVGQVQAVVGRVLFPALVRLHDDLPRFRAAHRRSLLLSAMVAAPLSVGAAATSEDLVLTLFGPAWAPMAPMLAILSVTGVQQVFQGTAGTLYQATGRTDLMFKWNVLFTVLTVAAFVIGIRWGAIGLCWAVFIRGWGLLPLTLIVPLHLVGERLRTIARLLTPLVVCLVVEGAVTVGVSLHLEGRIDSAPVRLLVEVCAGAAAYAVAVMVLLRPQLRGLMGVLRPGAVRTT